MNESIFLAMKFFPHTPSILLICAFSFISFISNSQDCSAVLGVTNVEKIHLTNNFSEDFEKAINRIEANSNNSTMQSGGSITLLVDGAMAPVSGFLNLSHSEDNKHVYTEQVKDLLTRSNTQDVYISQSAPGAIEAWKHCISSTVNPIALDGKKVNKQYSMTLTAPEFMIPRKITKVSYGSSGQNVQLYSTIVGREIGGQRPEINFFLPIVRDTGFFCVIEFERGKSAKFFSITPSASNLYGTLDAAILQQGGTSKNLSSISLNLPFVIVNSNHKKLPPLTKVLLKGEMEVNPSSFLDKNGDIMFAVDDINSEKSPKITAWRSEAWSIEKHQSVYKNMFKFIMVVETDAKGELNLKFNVQMWNIPNADARWQIGPNSIVNVYKY